MKRRSFSLREEAIDELADGAECVARAAQLLRASGDQKLASHANKLAAAVISLGLAAFRAMAN